MNLRRLLWFLVPLVVAALVAVAIHCRGQAPILTVSTQSATTVVPAAENIKRLVITTYWPKRADHPIEGKKLPLCIDLLRNAKLSFVRRGYEIKSIAYGSLLVETNEGRRVTLQLFLHDGNQLFASSNGHLIYIGELETLEPFLAQGEPTESVEKGPGWTQASGKKREGEERKEKRAGKEDAGRKRGRRKEKEGKEGRKRGRSSIRMNARIELRPLFRLLFSVFPEIVTRYKILSYRH
jgi:hypothetical protein